VQVIETSSRELGTEHHSTLTSMHNLAFMLKSQSCNGEAIFQLRKQILSSSIFIQSYCRTGSEFLTTILLLSSRLEPYVSLPRYLPRMSHRKSHRKSHYLFPLPNDDCVVILFATYLSPIWCIYRGSRSPL